MLIETTKRCQTCDEPFTVIAGRVGRPRLYCSNMCRNQMYVKRKLGFNLFEVIDAHGSECYLCHRPVELDAEGDDQPEVDHVVPVHFGGTNALANLRAVHRVCNMTKGSTIQCPNCHHRFA